MRNTYQYVSRNEFVASKLHGVDIFVNVYSLAQHCLSHNFDQQHIRNVVSKKYLLYR